MTLAVLGMYFLARPIMGSFAAIMAMLLLASGQVGLVLTNNPNSHASAMFFVMWGMVCLMLWWRSGRWWLGLLAGFLLGDAVTIRYTEGLLLGCIAVPMLCLMPYARRAEVRWWTIASWLVSLAVAELMLFRFDIQKTYLLSIPGAIASGFALVLAIRTSRADGGTRELIFNVVRALICGGIISACALIARFE